MYSHCNLGLKKTQSRRWKISCQWKSMRNKNKYEKQMKIFTEINVTLDATITRINNIWTCNQGPGSQARKQSHKMKFKEN
jgi:hypothetical protein